jgi:hypothetical protein
MQWQRFHVLGWEIGYPRLERAIYCWFPLLLDAGMYNRPML